MEGFANNNIAFINVINKHCALFLRLRETCAHFPSELRSRPLSPRTLRRMPVELTHEILSNRVWNRGHRHLGLRRSLPPQNLWRQIHRQKHERRPQTPKNKLFGLFNKLRDSKLLFCDELGFLLNYFGFINNHDSDIRGYSAGSIEERRKQNYQMFRLRFESEAL